MDFETVPKKIQRHAQFPPTLCKLFTTPIMSQFSSFKVKVLHIRSIFCLNDKITGLAFL